ncbi:O-antigen polymerase [uncultured Dokdonia sp.]|uniref:O-antigen polymerase n=1 Tax=Dokdonia sp. R78006 TaxID=3093866 RepID=UPI00261B6A4C|nr:O-antigen polymerase [uncultured Dokdonia sp.]
MSLWVNANDIDLNIKCKLGKAVLLGAYIVISTFLFANFATEIEVWASFFVSNLVLFTLLWWHLYKEKEYSPFISVYIVFNFLFFIIAPILQLRVIGNKNADFITNLPYTPRGIIYANVLVVIFTTFFFGTYTLLKKTRKTRVVKHNIESDKRLPLVLIGLLGISLFVFIASYDFVISEISRAGQTSFSVGTTALLLWKKLLFVVPLGGIILSVQYYKNAKSSSKNLLAIALVLMIFVMLLLWFKNPLVEKRNALGPIYISIIYLFIPGIFNSNVKTMFFMFFTMIIVFPLSAIITHVRSSLREIFIQPRLLLDEFEGEGIGEVFNTLHYDAFINIVATINYVKYEGFSYGYQLLSAFLFFVPRKIWPDKPTTTGQLVGEHLIDSYGFNFSNLSNPMVSEGYINFGVMGVILLAIALAYTLVYLLTWLQSSILLKKMMAFYFAIHLVFFLRGDFANGFSYYVGTLVGVMGIAKILDYFIKQGIINQQKWKQSHIKKA